jgi:hypothetical protein
MGDRRTGVRAPSLEPGPDGFPIGGGWNGSWNGNWGAGNIGGVGGKGKHAIVVTESDG